MQFAGGIPVNLRSTPGEINNDGIGSDRPAGVSRNSLSLPARYNVDLRLSRQIPIGRTKAEVIAEVTNVFNTVQWSGVTATIPVNASTGLPLNPLPASPLTSCRQVAATSSGSSSSGSGSFSKPGASRRRAARCARRNAAALSAARAISLRSVEGRVAVVRGSIPREAGRPAAGTAPGRGRPPPRSAA